MYIFKTSGETYERVITVQKHAFGKHPKDLYPEEIALICKNKGDLRDGEKELQYAMKIKEFRTASPSEIERYWPGHGHQWKYIVEMYDRMELLKPINLSEVIEIKSGYYKGIQNFRKVKEEDAQIFLSYIDKTEINITDENRVFDMEKTNNAIKRINNEYKDATSSRKERISKQLERDPRITSLLKKINPEKCQICQTLHFIKKSGTKYSEVHHIKALSEGGSQATDNCLVICANCHRKMHYASTTLAEINYSELKITINGEEFRTKRNIIK